MKNSIVQNRGHIVSTLSGRKHIYIGKPTSNNRETQQSGDTVYD